jgi:arylsulfatase A-like enzyme
LILAVGLAYFIFSSQTIPPRNLFSNALCPKCNVILVTLDTLGADHIQMYGYKRPTTPFLDSFGLGRSIVFDRAIAQGSWTPLSHVSILTGRYPAEHGIFGSTDKLPPEAKTIAESMKEQGYTTHGVSAAILIQPKWGWGQGFDSFEERWFIDSVRNNDAETTFSLASDWIKENKKKPFFLFINTNHLHSPHTPAGEQVMEEIGVPYQHLADERDIVGPHINAGAAEPTDLTLMKDYYDGLVRELDGVLAKFVKNLDEQGLTRNTIIIFEGDHSEQFGEHNILGWYGVYDTQIHVPFIMYVPGQAARRISPVVELRSIPATILDLVGAKPDVSFKGKSLLPLLEGKPDNTIALTMNAQTVVNNLGMLKALLSKAPTVWEAMRDVDAPEVRKPGDVPKELWHSASSTNWQLIKNDDGSLELYNLKKDPTEKENLIPKWYELPVDDRKEALDVFKALESDIPASCGLYCPK